MTDRWWPAVDARRLFACPPFPGSREIALLRADDAPSIGPLVAEIEGGIAAMRRLRVGGTFWAARATVPGGADVLARPADQACYHAMAEHARQHGRRLAWWFPNDRARDACAAGGGAIVGECDPWHLLDQVAEVWTAPDDELVMIAAISRVSSRHFEDAGGVGGGAPADAAAGLAALLSGLRIVDPFSGDAVTLSAGIELLGFWRAMIDANRPIAAICGVAFWKRDVIGPLLWSGGRGVPFNDAPPPGAAPATPPAVAAWIARTPAALMVRLESEGRRIYQIEDGFIRSVGLGADCVPPLSIVVDAEGAHYDPMQPSGLERLLATHEFTLAVLDRARRLRTSIVTRGISKYGGAAGPPFRRSDARRHVLVTGQVEDDQSVLKGGGGIASNLELLRRVRAIEPDAFIVYRPHPDVDAGHRKGHVDDDVALELADAIARDVGITTLIDAADQVHVLTSLAGFEALLRGKPVTTHGVPFYAGWGLTVDLGPVPARRGRRRSLDELVAATLLLYPRYLDPATGLPCPPEVLIARIAEGHRRQNSLLVGLRRLAGSATRLARRLRA